MSEARINRLATQSGHDPETVKEIVAEAWSAFYDATANRMADLGVTDGDAFMAFLNADSRRMNDMQTAARALVSENSTTGIDNIAAKFMEHADVYMADEVAGALEDAGVGYSRRADGRFLVKFDGTGVPFNVAVRQGLIKVS